MNKKLILMVDDDKVFLEAQSTILSHHGYEVITANNCDAGYVKAIERKPNLIILDVNMESEFSGFEFYKKLRSDQDIGKIPVILLTGIVTYSISNQIVEIYREIRSKEDIEKGRVLKIRNEQSDIADVGIEYFDEKGRSVYLQLESFVAKSDIDMRLVNEIERLMTS
jgi:CheY-like chemotaxis protein